MCRIVCCLLVLAAGLVHAQVPPSPAASKAAAELKKIASEGEPIGVDSNVARYVSVQAVLLPPSVSRRVFGKEITNNYAAVQLVISNRNHEASMIVHSLFLDYSGWAISGSPAGLQSRADENPREDWESATKRNQVASVEYRVARGQLLDAQPWTKRNIIRRSLQVAGAVASAFVFNVADETMVQGITAATGITGPLFDYFWPDATIGQMNRISDVGFQVNKVIAKESSDIIVAFFPLDRFMTGDLKRIYLEAPAALFAPYAMVVDKSVARLFKPVYSGLLGKEAAEDFMVKAPQAYFYRTEVTRRVREAAAVTPKGAHPPSTADFESKVAAELKADQVTLSRYAQILSFLDRASLNNIRVVVSGIMVVDADSVPAHIDDVTFDSGNRSAATWLEPGEKRGVIRGRFLTGGEVSIAGTATLGIEGLESVKEGSNDRELRFRFKLKSALASGANLEFRVTRKDKSGRSIESNLVTLPVAWEPPAAPAVTAVERVGDKLTITGERFYSIQGNPVAVELLPVGNPAAGSIKVAARLITAEPAKLTIDLAPLKLLPACWTPKVSTVAAPAAVGPGVKPFLQKPGITLAEAKKSADGKTVTLTGAGLVDLKACGAPLQLFVRQSQTGAKLEPVQSLNLEAPSKATFAMPQQPASARWTVVAKFAEDPEIAGPEIQ